MAKRRKVGHDLPFGSYAALARAAIFAMVAREQPVAAWMADHDSPARNIAAIPAFLAASSGRPRYFPSAFALACPLGLPAGLTGGDLEPTCCGVAETLDGPQRLSLPPWATPCTC